MAPGVGLEPTPRQVNSLLPYLLGDPGMCRMTLVTIGIRPYDIFVL